MNSSDAWSIQSGKSGLMSGLTVAALLISPLVLADTPTPDAGRILESVRPLPPLPKALPVLPKVEEPARPALGAAGDLRIPLKRLRITGAGYLPVADLEALGQELIGREVTLAELDALVQRITRHLRERDAMLARAYIPAQDIVDGVVEIAILEGHVGEALVRNQSSLRDSVAQALVAGLPPGGLIRESAVERATWLADDLPGIEAASTLRPGKQVGTSDFVLELRDGASRTGSLELDNSGGRYTGHYRLGGSLAFNNPGGFGDRLSTRLLSSGAGLVYGHLGYQIPLGYDGANLGFSLTRAEYELGKDFANLDATGSALVAGVNLNYALIRSTRKNLRLLGGWEQKSLKDRNVGSDKQKAARVASLGLAGDQQAAAGKWAYSAQFHLGRLEIESPLSLAFDQATARTHGAFSKFTWNLARQQYLGRGFSLSANYSGQWSPGNLDSSEKMSIGGLSGVRGYPQSEASGDSAHLLRLELRHPLELTEGMTPDLLLSFDHGASRLVTDAWAGYTGARLRHLYSAGLGLVWRAAQDWNLRAEYAWRLGNEEALSEPDARGRFWFTLQKTF